MAALPQFDYLFAIGTIFAFLDAWNIGMFSPGPEADLLVLFLYSLLRGLNLTVYSRCQ